MAPTLANGSTLASHKVFQIPEIVELILSFLDDASNASNARVCKKWSDIALNLLWREVPDIQPLFEILSPLEQVPGRRSLAEVGYLFTRKLGVSDWERLSRYSRRVRALVHGPDWPKPVSTLAFDEVARSRPTLHILPNLRSLAWLTLDSDGMRSSLMFMHEHIVQFSASLYRNIEYPLSDYFKEVVLRMPHLTHLDLRFDFAVHHVEPDLIALVRGLPKLKQVIFPLYSLTTRIVQAMSTLPHLGTIQFEFKDSQGQGDVEDVLHFAPKLREGAFPALWDLSLSARLQDVTTLLNNAYGPTNLTTLYIHVLTPTQPDEVTRFLNALAENCQLMTHLYLDYMTSSMVQAQDDPDLHPRLSWDALRPLLALPNLVVFELRWDQPIQITQADIEEIAPKWPSLEVFLFNCEPLDPSEESTLTVHALLPFARHCPKLRELGLYIDATKITDEDAAALGPSVKPFKSLERVCMGLSSISDPGPVALFLSRLCPLTCELTSGVTWPEGFGMAETSTNRERLDALQTKAAVWWEKWAEASKVLPLLTKLRIQERDARAEMEKEVEDLRTRCRLLSARAGVQMEGDDSCVAC
ncbi:hypothetical protein EUX98_g5183 [Antrodiella citrinella]|uniref:F-box domain-containing protein n=1 Tax=Antrodiella citrinella TaxID=2447956 RepID=A0A4S4N010_9APHY|nr:hypothetical protein EUX98_g5183 [Antrodiella citrinella]